MTMTQSKIAALELAALLTAVALVVGAFTAMLLKVTVLTWILLPLGIVVLVAAVWLHSKRERID